MSFRFYIYVPNPRVQRASKWKDPLDTLANFINVYHKRISIMTTPNIRYERPFDSKTNMRVRKKKFLLVATRRHLSNLFFHAVNPMPSSYSCICRVMMRSVARRRRQGTEPRREVKTPRRWCPRVWGMQLEQM